MQHTMTLQLNHFPSFSWIALNPEGEVVGSGPTLAEAEKEAKKKGIEHPALLKIPPKEAIYVPTSF